MKAEDFIGMSKKRAQDAAEIRNFIFRVIRVDTDKYMDYPEDIRTDRICVEVDNGKVTKASIQ